MSESENDNMIGEVFIFFDAEKLGRKKRNLERQGYKTSEEWEDVAFGPVGTLKVVDLREHKET